SNAVPVPPWCQGKHTGPLTRGVMVRVHPEEPMAMTNPSVAEQAYAAVSNTALPASSAGQMWVRIPPLGPSWRGHSRRKDAALAAREYGFESRCPRQDGGRLAEGRDGDLGSPISSNMRVRFPPPRPTPVRSTGGRRSYTPHTG